MPNVSASQYTQYVRSNAYQAQKRDGGVKMITHLYQPYVTTTGLSDFLTNPNTPDRHYAGFYKTTAMKGNQNYSYAAAKYIR